MTDYQVGNLQIVFEAVDQTASAFEDLSKNLRAIKNVINNLGNIDTSKLNSLKKNLQDITKAFSPFLTKVKGASQGLADFNSTIKQIGVKNLSSVSSEIIDIAQKAQQATQAQEEFTHGIENGSAQATNALEEQKKVIDKLIAQQKVYEAQPLTKPELLKDITSYKEIIKELNQELANTKAAYALIVEGGKVGGFDNATIQTAQQLQQEINNTETTIQGLKEQLADLQAQFGAPFNEAQSAVSALKNELLNVYYATNTINNEQVQEWQRLTAKINETTNAVNNALMSDDERVIVAQKAAIAAKQEELALLKANYALGNLNITSKEYAQRVDNLETEIKRLSGAVDEVDKPVKKTTNSWKKFLNQIKRVAIYRLIRTLLKSIVSTFRDTINAFAQVDDGVNDTMSSLTSSLNIIKLSIGTSILPLLQMIEPIVSQIAVAFANLGNTISQAMSTTGKYTKINTDALQDYRKQLKQTQGSLLDFDKFRVLNQQEGQLTDFLLPDQDVDESNEHVMQVRLTIESLKKTIEGVWNIIQGGWHAVEPILTTALRIINDTIIPAISTLVDWLGKAVHWLDEVGLLEAILYTIVGVFVALKATKIINWIKDLTSKFNLWYLAIAAVATAIGIISNWDNFSKSTKQVITILATLTAALTAAAVAAMALHGSLTLGTAVPLIITAVAAGAIAIKGFTDPATFAQGGIPDKGTMFVAGERGAEMVYNMPSGQSGVDISQTQQAMYNALVQYGRENRGEDTPININIDGQKVFEATRQTAKRRGLGFGNI